MNRLVLVLLVVLLCPMGYSVAAQEESKMVEGHVYLSEGEPAEMALVALHADSVSANPVAFTYTDKQGYYQLSLPLPYAQHYIVAVDYVGFETVSATFLADSIKGTEEFDINFTRDSKTVELDAVKVSAQRKVGINRQSYTFTREQIAQAKSSFNLALLLPELKLNGKGEIASATNDDPPLVLINGHYGTLQELRSIPATKIIKIDYFDVAPERFNTTKSVIDVVTKALDDGHHAGFEAYTAPLMHDVSGSIYYNFNSGSHQFKFFTKGFYRKLRKGRKSEEVLDYTTWRKDRFEEEGISKFQSADAFLKASYSYNVPKKQFLEVFYSSDWQRYKSPTQYSGDVFLGSDRQHRAGERRYSDGALVQVVDIYYDHYLSERGDKIMANAVYTNANSFSEYDLHETLSTAKDSLVLENDMHGRTFKNSIITQLDYELPLGRMGINAGTTVMFSHAKFAIDQASTLSVVDRQQQLRGRLYGAWSMALSNFFIRVVPAVNAHYVSKHKGLDRSATRWTFNPMVALGWYLPHDSRLRLNLGTENNVPDLGETAEVTYLEREDLYIRNNPALQNSYDAVAQLTYTWRNRYLSIRNVLTYNYTDKFWVSDYLYDNVGGKRVLVMQKVNGLYSQLVGLRVSLGITPLGDDRLTIRPYVNAMFLQFNITKEKRVSGFSIPAGASIVFQQNGWGAQCEATVPYNSITGSFRGKTDAYGSLMGFWSNGAWSVYLALEYMFNAVSYEATSHGFFDLYRRSKTIERDEHWKASLTVNYYFSIGKSYQRERGLENEDSDRGTLY